MKKNFLAVAALSALFFSCSSDDDPVTEVENQEEVITNFVVTLTDEDENEIVLFAEDADGDGELETIMGGTLLEGKFYTGSISLTNEIEGEDITEEVAEEDEDHQFFFESEDGLNIATFYEDSDGNGDPVGLNFTLETGEASEGDLKISLIHQPTKSAEGVSDGDITNAGGETDISVDFPITIEPVAPVSVQ